MTDPKTDAGEDFAPTRDHEYQDAHYHDDDAEIVADDVGDGVKKTHPRRPHAPRRLPPPKKRYFDD